MSLYVLDTDVVSLLMKGKLAEAVRGRLERLSPDRVATTAITLGELHYGALRSSVPEKWRHAVQELASRIACLPFDRAAAMRYGEVRACLELRGRPVADADLRIAAICLATDRTLVSGNDRHFTRIPGLRYENWTKRGK